MGILKEITSIKNGDKIAVIDRNGMRGIIYVCAVQIKQGNKIIGLDRVNIFEVKKNPTKYIIVYCEHKEELEDSGTWGSLFDDIKPTIELVM